MNSQKLLMVTVIWILCVCGSCKYALGLLYIDQEKNFAFMNPNEMCIPVIFPLKLNIVFLKA